MNYRIIFVILIMDFIIKTANGRIHYVNVPRNDDDYPVAHYITDVNGEQASKNLGLTFSTGDALDYDDIKNIIYPLRQNYISPVRPVMDIIHENDRPVYLYKWPEDMSTLKRFIYGGEGIENPNLIKYKNGNKGEVILELRVTANNGKL